MNNLCVVIFAQNETGSLFKTWEKILELSKKVELNNVIKEVFVIDDGSSLENKLIIDDYFQNLNHNYPFKFHFISQNALGISKSVNIAVGSCLPSTNLVLPLPGHDMFDFDSLFKLLSHSSHDQLTIGYRFNLWRERPLLKYISAKILTYSYKLLVFWEIKDAHGLYVIPIELAKTHIKYNQGHEILILPLYVALKKGIKVSQIPVMLQKGHKRESMTLGRSRRTRLKHIKSSINCFALILQDKFLFNKY
jgi:hypothetical protein